MAAPSFDRSSVRALRQARTRAALLIGVIVGAGIGCGPAFAGDPISDRAELDAAAGRAVFQPTSLYDSLQQPPPLVTQPTTRPPTPPGGRRPIRVVYPRYGDDR